MAIVYGTRVRISAQFKDASNALVDPTTIRLIVLTPRTGANARLQYTYQQGGDIVRDSIGIYHLDLLPNFLGQVRFQWASQGAGQESINEGSFTIVVPTVL